MPDVVLLCHFDNAFVDASSYAHTLTPAGLTAISTANQKFGAGSAFYNIGNAASSISTNNSADFHFGSAPFTIEAWCYAIQTGTGDGYNPILAEWDSVLGNVSFFFNVFPAYQFFWSPDGTAYSYLNASPSALPLNTWTHVAADRDSSNVLRIYVNGVVVASGSCPDSFYPSTYPCMIGNDAGANRPFPGYLDEVRVVRGTAMYGGPFTPPTAPFPNPPVNIAPTGIASTTAFGTTSVSPGAVSITATGIAKTNAFGTASLSTGAVNIAATGIGSITAFGTAAIARGAVNVAPPGIASTNAFGTAAIIPGVGGPQSILLTGIASTTAFGTVTFYFNVIWPSGIGSVTAFGNLTLAYHDNPVYPYAGQSQETQVHVPAAIAYKYIDWEESCWVMPPYAMFYPGEPVVFPAPGRAKPTSKIQRPALPIGVDHRRIVSLIQAVYATKARIRPKIVSPKAPVRPKQVPQIQGPKPGMRSWRVASLVQSVYTAKAPTRPRITNECRPSLY